MVTTYVGVPEPLKQPKNLEEILYFLKEMGNIKSGYNSMPEKYGIFNACSPCQLVRVDIFKVAQLLEEIIKKEYVKKKKLPMRGM